VKVNGFTTPQPDPYCAQVLKLQHCVNRDVMMARNIRMSSMSMAMNKDGRPIRFRGAVKATAPTINAEEPPRGEGTSLTGKTPPFRTK